MNGVKDGNISRFFENREGQLITYEYQCQKCNNITEAEFTMGNADDTVHCGNPECEDGIATRIISTPNILVGIPTHPARKGRGQG